MTKFAQVASLLGCALMLGALASPAQAQSLRTFVSGAGNDANPCSRTAPCRTFAGAYAQTMAGGEIDTLDAAGYGPLTITQSISIINDGAGTAGITPASEGDGDGIDIEGGSNVNLRGLVIDGTNNNGTTSGRWGIRIISGTGHVNIQSCVVQGFQLGILVELLGGTADVKIQDTTSTGNSADGVSIEVEDGGTATVAIDRSHIDNNGGDGVGANVTGGSSGVVTISDSSISLNAGDGVDAFGEPTVRLNGDVLMGNVQAGVATSMAGSVQIGNSMLSENGAATSIDGGVIQTNGNNQVTGSPGSGFNESASLQ